jgi:hypothetical protein
LVGLERDGSKNHILTNRGDQVSLWKKSPKM